MLFLLRYISHFYCKSCLYGRQSINLGVIRAITGHICNVETINYKWLCCISVMVSAGPIYEHDLGATSSAAERDP